jgi:tRNA (Thr-GGU) A37 N-methylase
VVRLVRIEGSVMHIEDLDMVDGTPLLDVKPYVPPFELSEKVRIGWLTDLVRGVDGKKDDGRFDR